MSLEAWGDEGDVPQRAEDTAMLQEFRDVLAKYKRWRQRFESDAPSDVILGGMKSLADTLDHFDDLLKEALEP